MKKTDGTGDKATHITDKNQPNDPKSNDINRQYEKALNSKDKPPRDASNSRALSVSPDKQKIVTTKKISERRELRANNPRPTSRQNRLLRTKNNKRNDIIDNNDDDGFDTHTDDNRKKSELLTDIDSGTHSNNQHNDDDNNNNNKESDKKNIGHYKKNDTDLYIDSVNASQDTKQNPNSAEYLEFLKTFVTEFNTVPENEMIIQKAMVQDTITQMFDQFLIGMNNFDKTTKQHHVFGQGAHLCQKILISLKNDAMSDALLHIKRLIPKR